MAFIYDLTFVCMVGAVGAYYPYVTIAPDLRNAAKRLPNICQATFI